MTFKEILDKTEWEYVEKHLHYYDDKEENRIIDTQKFKKVYEELKLLTPSDDKSIEIIIEYSKVGIDEEDAVCVDGFSKKENQRYGLEVSEWERWLGWETSKQSLKDFTYSEIIAHCLWEMTFFGFDQETIQNAL